MKSAKISSTVLIHYEGAPSGKMAFIFFFGAWGSEPPSAIPEDARFMGNPLNDSDALFGMQACPRYESIPCCDSAVLTVTDRGKISCTGKTEALYAPPPPTGAGLAQGGDKFQKNRFSTEQKILLKAYPRFRRRKKPIIPRAPSAVSGITGECNAGVTGRRVAETVPFVPAVIKILVE